MRTITYSDYFDKAYGCWLGKSIGGACGALSENNKDILHYTLDNVFPDSIPPNDDLDLQVLWLVDLLEKKGTAITAHDFAKSFAGYNLCLANEYAVAIKNIQGGIMPPYSGDFLNDYFKNSMGCPIRSEIWAVTAPGSIKTLKYYVEADGSVDHTTESIYAELFNAVMESNAFFESDLIALTETALREIPENCRIHDVAGFALDCYTSRVDWTKARNRLVLEYGSQDASYCVTNCGLTLLALLYGEKDYTKTLLYAVNGGFDTDCTAATALSVLGIITGAKNTPQFWLDKIGTELIVGTVDINCPYKTIESFAEATCRAGLSFQKEGRLEVEITHIPEGITPSLPHSAFPDIAITADYEGAPVIGIGESKTVVLTVKNNSGQPVSDTLKITPALVFNCDISEMKICISPGGEFSTKAVFTVKEGIKRLPVDNLNTVSFGNEKICVGICGAYVMNMIGPFWDNYDTAVCSENPYGERMQKNEDGSSDIRAMFSGFVNIDREYIDESFAEVENIIGGKALVPCKRVNIHGDIFDVDSDVSYIGPACVYLVYDFYAEEAAQGVYHFGNTAPFKVWENGKLICENHDHCTWTPFNINAPANINYGENRLVFKLARQDSFRFSFAIRNALDNARYFHRTESILKG